MRALVLTTAAFAVALALPAFAQNNQSGSNNGYTQNQPYQGGQQGYSQGESYQGGQQYGEQTGQNGSSSQGNYQSSLGQNQGSYQGNQGQFQSNGGRGYHQVMKVERQLRHDLQQQGFTDIRIQPEGFLVQARDPHGNPVTMLLTPNSVTAVTEGTNGRSGNGNMGNEGMNNRYSQFGNSGQGQSGSSSYSYSQNGGGSEH